MLSDVHYLVYRNSQVRSILAVIFLTCNKDANFDIVSVIVYNIHCAEWEYCWWIRVCCWSQLRLWFNQFHFGDG